MSLWCLTRFIHCFAECCNAECRYAECYGALYKHWIEGTNPALALKREKTAEKYFQNKALKLDCSIVRKCYSLYFCYTVILCSFGNPAITKEHRLQNYPHLSHFDPLVVMPKSIVLAPSPSYFRIHFHGSTDLPNLYFKAPFYFKHLCLYYRYLYSEKLSLEFEILNPS